MSTLSPALAPVRTKGMTLVEMLVAMALTLIMFAAVAQIFAMMGSAMRDARATIELSGNLRTVNNHLQRDLNNMTSDAKPWVYQGSNQGYFEIVEGPDRDVDFASLSSGTANSGLDKTEFADVDASLGVLSGDADDILSFTAYSKDEPFVGLIRGVLQPTNSNTESPFSYFINTSGANANTFSAITSNYAEITYWTRLTPIDDRNLYGSDDPATQDTEGYRDATETVTLYRRVRLIRPDIYFGAIDESADPDTYTPLNLGFNQANNDYDLSIFATATNQWQTNSLEQLQLRRHRVGHYRLSSAPAFPFPMRPHELFSFEQLNTIIGSGNLRNRTGEDVLLTRVLAFDVKVFDPMAIVKTVDGNLAVEPTDDGYGQGVNPTDEATASLTMTGAFVDLNWGARSTVPSGNGVPTPHYSGIPEVGSGLDGFQADSAVLFGTTPADINALIAAYDQMPSRLVAAGTTAPDKTLTYSFYDTWPFAYEHDGTNQDGDGSTDEGTDGFDDNGDGVVDDENELETSPPYRAPLRGISVTVRAYEEGTRQVRQDVIVADFLP